jgi:1-aminocyclopropane-1-carboxylate deaminase
LQVHRHEFFDPGLLESLLKDPDLSLSSLCKINIPSRDDLELYIKRDDLIHPIVSGNKWRKLEPVVKRAIQEKKGLVSIGGPYSNHLHALAFAGKHFSLPTIAIVKKHLTLDFNEVATLKQMKDLGADIIQVDLKSFRKRQLEPEFMREVLKENRPKFDLSKFILLPEGGWTALGEDSTSHLIAEVEQKIGRVDHWCTAIGSSCTARGLIKHSDAELHVYSPFCESNKINQDLLNRVKKGNSTKKINFYPAANHLGAFGKPSSKLIEFCLQFKKKYAIALDPIYTSKMLYRLMEQIHNGHFSAKVLAIHTGGLQSWQGIKSPYLI